MSPSDKIRPAGFEPATCGLEDRSQKDASGLLRNDLRDDAESGYSDGYSGRWQREAGADTTRQLECVAANWVRLPEHIRKTILTLVEQVLDIPFDARQSIVRDIDSRDGDG